MKGPVPMGALFRSSLVPAASSASAYSLDTIDMKGMATLARNGASGWFSVTLTVRSSTFSTDFTSFGISIEL